MKKPLTFVHLVVTGLLMLASTIVYAKTTPPAVNDECSGAIFITPMATNSYITYDNYGSTLSTGVPAPSCATPLSGDVWFAVIVPASGHLIFDSKSGSMTDGGMAIYTGSCGSLSLVECSDTKYIGFPANDSMPQIDKIGLPVYMMVYIRFWGKGVNNYGTFQLSVVGSTLQPPDNNLGFENAYNGWFTTLGQQHIGDVGALTPVYFPITINDTTNPNVEIQTSGIDPNCGFLKVYNGNKSIRLGDLTIDQTYDAASIEQTFPVGVNNANFIYHYAVVLRNLDHINNIDPFLKIELFDANGNLDSCGGNLLRPDNTTLLTGAGVKYKPWTSQSINLSAYIGQNVTIRFTISDCSNSPCFGYAYLDCECQPFTIANTYDTICPGNFDTLTAPEGALSYLWSPGGATQQSVIVNPTVTTTYACNVTTKGGGNCAEVLYKTVYVGQTGLPVPDNAGNIISTCNNVAAQGQQNVFSQVAPINDADTYEWTYSGNGVSFYPSNITTNAIVYLNFSSTATTGELKVRGLNNCGGIGAYSHNYHIDVGVGVNENKDNAQFIMYPNPAKDNLIIEINTLFKKNTTVSIYNIQGQLLKQLAIKESKTEIDIRSFDTGIYIVKVNNEKENLVSRFVKE